MSIPAYIRQRKGHGRQDVAIVKIDGRRHHLGVYNSPESLEKYDALIAEHFPSEPQKPALTDGAVTVNRLLLSFLRDAQATYIDRDGNQTREYGHFKTVAKILREQCGRELAKDFGPKRLKQIREVMVGRGWCRSNVNKQVGRVVRMFRWAVSEELIAAEVHTALETVDGLKKGQTAAPEGTKREPVPLADVAATVAELPQVVADMVMVQLHTGMRPGELFIMRPIDLDTTGEIWLYTPEYHKTESTGDRVIAIGPKAQEILLRYLARDPEAYLFSPRDSEAKRLAEREASGISHGRKPRKQSPREQLREKYGRHSYAQAVRRAAERAGVDHWTPYQLRHTALTAAREAGGLDARTEDRWTPSRIDDRALCEVQVSKQSPTSSRCSADRA